MVFAGLAAMAIASATAADERYGDWLLRWELSRNSEVRNATIELDGPPSAQFHAGNTQRHSKQLELPLSDGVGDRIGTLSLGLARGVPKAEAGKIALDLSRHFYSPAVLGEPVPFVSNAFHSKTGQALVERELAREPRLVTIALHVAVSGHENEIIASNFGRIGKAADADDQHVIKDSAILQEETNAGRRLAVELPLLDKAGHTIGALSTSFLTGSDGKEGAYRSALRVQHELSRAIRSLKSLAR